MTAAGNCSASAEESSPSHIPDHVVLIFVHLYSDAGIAMTTTQGLYR